MWWHIRPEAPSDLHSFWQRSLLPLTSSMPKTSINSSVAGADLATPTWAGGEAVEAPPHISERVSSGTASANFSASRGTGLASAGLSR